MDNAHSTTTCGSCGAPITPVPNKAYFVCHYCGAYYFPDASEDGIKLLGEPGTLTCPVCKIPLVTAAIQDYHVQACSKCRGVMINQDQLAFIIRTLRLTSKKIEEVLPLNRADLNAKRVCQTCGMKMDTHAYEGGGNIVIDMCVRCGVIWFDYGEIKRVISSPEIGINRQEREFIDHMQTETETNLLNKKRRFFF
jgi:Zn-finger nucleic acid-binding protein